MKAQARIRTEFGTIVVVVKNGRLCLPKHLSIAGEHAAAALGYQNRIVKLRTDWIAAVRINKGYSRLPKPLRDAAQRAHNRRYDRKQLGHGAHALAKEPTLDERYVAHIAEVATEAAARVIGRAEATINVTHDSRHGVVRHEHLDWSKANANRRYKYPENVIDTTITLPLAWLRQVRRFGSAIVRFDWFILEVQPATYVRGIVREGCWTVTAARMGRGKHLEVDSFEVRPTDAKRAA